MDFNNTTLNANLHSISKNQALEFYYCVGKLNCHKNKVVCTVSWKKPHLEWCKLNTDGPFLVIRVRQEEVKLLEIVRGDG